MTMFAYGFTRYGGPETQSFMELSDPVPGVDGVLVEVRAAGVNPVDWKVRAGQHQAFLPLTLPAVFGREVAGVVVRDGAGFWAGDAVFGSMPAGCGGYATLAVLPADRMTHKPDSVSFTDAAALPVAVGTAYDAVEQLGVAPGETLLVLGAGGGVGVAAVQLARAAGASVVGTASTAKRHLVESLGATAIAYDAEDFDQVVRATSPDAVLDLVGTEALRRVAPLLGLPGAGRRVLTVADPATAAEVGARPLRRTSTAATLTELARRVSAGRLDPHVRRVFPFVAAADALAWVESGHAAGKVVITFE